LPQEQTADYRQIECSYDSARPAHLMFGHISPPGMLYELKKLAAGVKRVDGK
jgi:cAMP phosphodiesterase